MTESLTESFMRGFEHLWRLLGKDKRFVFYLEVGLAEADNLRELLSAMNEVSRTLGAHGYLFHPQEPVTMNDRFLIPIEAVPFTADGVEVPQGVQN